MDQAGQALNNGVTNTPVVNALQAAFNNFLAVDPGNDPWEQDGYSIGYAQAPGPNGTLLELPVVLELPRASDFTDNNGNVQLGLRNFIEGTILQPNVAVIRPFNDANNRNVSSYVQNIAVNSEDSGGNIGSLPSNGGGNDVFFHGQGMSWQVQRFFSAQGVNASDQVNTDWLSVGHVDEVVSLAPNGNNVDVADPDLAWALLLWADKVAQKANQDPLMLQDMDGYDAAPNVPAGISIGEVVNDTNAEGGVLKQGQQSLEAYNQQYVMDSLNLPSIETSVEKTMGISAPQSTPVAGNNNAGTAKLAEGGAFDAFLPSGVTSYLIQFTDNKGDYQLSYKEPGMVNFVVDNADGGGNIDMDEVFPHAGAYIMAYWWHGNPAKGDTFTYQANTNAGIVDVPVLFYDDQSGNFGANPKDNASEYTTDFVNSLFNGDTVYTGVGWGPEVDYLGTGNATDILQDYAGDTFKYLDHISNVVYIDGRFYHDTQGFLHCATNVIRNIPNSPWWKN